MNQKLALALLFALFQVYQFSGKPFNLPSGVKGLVYRFNGSPRQPMGYYYTLQRKCGLNAHYRERCSRSGKSCAPRCDQLVPTFCRAICIPACDCLPGFVFKGGQSGACIRPSECSIQSKEDQQCGPNAGYNWNTHLEIGCTPNCNQPTVPLNCTETPEMDGAGCRCVDGFIYKEGQSGECILPEECPTKRALEE